MESGSEYNPPFLLSKWYPEGVAPSGSVVLCHSAILKCTNCIFIMGGSRGVRFGKERVEDIGWTIQEGVRW